MESIGIIGGSDGPTAIFIAGKLGMGAFVVAGVLILAAIVGLYLIFRKKK